MDAVDAIAPGEPPAKPTKIVSAISATPRPRRRTKRYGAQCASTCSISSFPPTGSRCGPRGRATARGCCWSRATRSPTGRCCDLPDLLRPGDVLVFNDTKVIPGAARRPARRGQHRRDAAQARGPREWQAFLRNAKRARVGDVIDFGEGVHASVGREGRRTGRRCCISTATSRSNCCSSAPGGCRCRPTSLEARRRRRGPRRLSDDVRARGRRGRRADRRAALHAAAARRAR